MKYHKVNGYLAVLTPVRPAMEEQSQIPHCVPDDSLKPEIFAQITAQTSISSDLDNSGFAPAILNARSAGPGPGPSLIIG
jgi:hypothetical protein